jgi:CHAT domain-containing protein
LTKQLKDDGTTIECLQTIALVALQKGQYRDAAEQLAEAESLETPAPNRQRQLYTRLIAAQISVRTQDFSRAEGIYSELLRDPVSRMSLRWEAQAGLAIIHAAQGKAEVAEKEFRESISEFSKAWRDIEQEEYRLSFLSSAIRFYDAYVGFLIAQRRPLDALKIADLSRAQTLEHGLASSANGTTNGVASLVKSRKGHALAQAGAFRPQDIARRLNATVLFYWLGEQRSYLWAITPGATTPAKVSLFTLPGRAEIDAAVKSYLEAFTDPRDPLEAGNADGKKLYATLIQPVEKLIPKNSRVVILADGSLNTLNFETMIVSGEKPHYWIEDVTLQTANSLSLLSRTSVSAPPKSANLLLVGDALAASPDFPPLPEAGKEVGLVENYFPADRRSVLTRAQATASRFLEGKPGEFSYLHFAAHGTASTTRPLESAVILSREGDSYKLYARDIVQHPLKAYLVTISACNGAGLRTYAGEGLVGLSWAFLRAGAHNVIAGLWEVSNASTPQLMDELYKGLSAGQEPATALRNAKLTLVHSKDNYRRPFYWGPFQLYSGS